MSNDNPGLFWANFGWKLNPEDGNRAPTLRIGIESPNIWKKEFGKDGASANARLG